MNKSYFIDFFFLQDKVVARLIIKVKFPDQMSIGVEPKIFLLGTRGVID